MEYLPPAGWADVATRRDVDQLGLLLQGELSTTAAELRRELSTTAAELRAEIVTLAGELRAELAAQTRVLLFGLVGAFTGLGGLIVAVGRGG